MASSLNSTVGVCVRIGIKRPHDFWSARRFILTPSSTIEFHSKSNRRIASASEEQQLATDNPNVDEASGKRAAKKSPLTARERLKAARLRNRSEMGTKVLDVLKESEKGKKRSGLPEAPTNLFDDSKRGLPKAGWTFQFPGGSDLFFIIVSFVTISTIMLATTYVVWKSGAIHFNEY